MAIKKEVPPFCALMSRETIGQCKIEDGLVGALSKHIFSYLSESSITPAMINLAENKTGPYFTLKCVFSIPDEKPYTAALKEYIQKED